MWILKTEYLGRTGAPLMGCFVDSIRLTASDSQIRPISVFGSIGFHQIEDCCLTAHWELFFIGIDGPFPDAILWERRAECHSGAPRIFPHPKGTIPMSSRKMSRRQFVGTTSFMALGLPVVLGRAYPAFGA